MIKIAKMKTNLKISTLLLLSLLTAASLISAQEPPDDAPIKVDTLLYTIPLTVSDKNGRAVSGLRKENFSVVQDGQPQQIEFFLNEEAPMNVAILIDTSGSTRPVLDKIQKAARDFIKVLRAGDKGAIVSFNYKTSFLSGLTSDHSKLAGAISSTTIAAQDGSDVNDAVSKVINDIFLPIKGRKAIIVLTDGIVSERSVYNYQVLNLLQKSDTVFYPIIFKTSTYSVKDANNPTVVHYPYEPLQQMADETAGRLYMKDAKDLDEVFKSISEELKKQYLIGYYPHRNRPPDSVKIEVDRKNMKINVKKTRLFER